LIIYISSWHRVSLTSYHNGQSPWITTTMMMMLVVIVLPTFILMDLLMATAQAATLAGTEEECRRKV